MINREWIDSSNYYVDEYKRKSAVNFAPHIWDDIKQEVSIRLWKKQHLYNKAKPLKPWIKTVTINAVKNCIRDRVTLPKKNKNLREFKVNVLYPQKIGHRIIRKNIFDEGVVECYPDIIDHKSTENIQDKYDFICLFLKGLNERERVILSQALDGDSIPKLSKKNKINVSSLYKWRKILRLKYKNTLDKYE